MTIAIMVAAFILVGAAGIISTKYLGPDNPVEEEAEVLMEDEAEDVLHLPEGSLKGKIDLTPKSKENK